MDKNDTPFIWWMGVVESRQDSLKLGRCRVRIFGRDSALETDRNSLLFADVSQSPNNRTNKTPYEGDWVWGFYRDGNTKQQPVIVGILPGINSEISVGEGFSDSRTIEEINESPSAGRYPLPDDVGKPSTSKYYRGEDYDKAGTVFHNIKTLRKTNIPTATGGSWEQPESSYNAKCPYNSVQESESGHLFEMDDTPNHERVHIAHRTGSFIEYRPDGSVSKRVNGKNYSVLMDDNNVYIQGTANVTIAGNITLIVNGNVDAKIIGDTNIDTMGDVSVTTQGTLDVNAVGNMTMSTQGEMKLQSPSRIILNTPLVNATKDIKANNDIFDVTGGKSMRGMRAIFNSHVHPENDHGGPTNVPIKKM